MKYIRTICLLLCMASPLIAWSEEGFDEFQKDNVICSFGYPTKIDTITITQAEYDRHYTSGTAAHSFYEKKENTGADGSSSVSYYRYDTKFEYMTAQKDGDYAIALEHTVSTYALWRIHADGNSQFRYENVATGQWLKFEISEDSVVTLLLVDTKEQSSAILHEKRNRVLNISNKGRAFVFLKTTNPAKVSDEKGLYVYYNTDKQAPCATAVQSKVHACYYEMWEYRKDEKALSLTASASDATGDVTLLNHQIVFSYADSARMIGSNGYTEQQATLSIQAQVTNSTYYHNIPANICNYEPKRLDVSSETIANPQVSFEAVWKDPNIKKSANGTQDSLCYSYLHPIYEANRPAKNHIWRHSLNAEQLGLTFDTIPYKEYGDRSVLVFEAQHSADAQQWQAIVKPVGKSPIDICLWDGAYWVRYKDTLVVTATLKGSENVSAVSEVSVERVSCHVMSDYEIKPYLSADDLQFEQAGGVLDCRIDSIEETAGLRIYRADERFVVREVMERHRYLYSEIEKHNITLNCKIVSPYVGMSAPTWMTINGETTDEGIVPLRATANLGGGMRTAAVQATVSKQVGNNMETGDAMLTFEQKGLNDMGAATFIPNPGVSGYPLTEDHRQQVHTIETTIYYQVGDDSIPLQLKERNFLSYMRWYDYNTGKDPQYHLESDGTVRTLPDFWKQFPYEKKSANEKFQSLNANPEHSHGLYCLIPKGWISNQINANDNDRLTVPAVHLEEPLELDIACDVSNYTDYEEKFVKNSREEDSLVSLKEPTLSYRQIFHLRPTKDIMTDTYKNTIADSLAKCTNKTKQYYEEYKFSVPVGTPVNLQTQYELVRLQGAASPYCYWVHTNSGLRRPCAINDKRGYSEAWPWWFRWNGSQFIEYKDTKDDDFNVMGTGNYYADWSNGGYQDYVRVKYDKDTTMMWAVWIVPGQGGTFGTDYTGDTIWLAKFTVEWTSGKSQYGPSSTSLVTLQDIEENYIMLANRNFDYNEPNTTELTLYGTPLPPDESTYGFAYPESVIHDKIQRRYPWSKPPYSLYFPYYGEYAIVNKVGIDDWLNETAQHGGGTEDATKGYCLYVDGAQQAGKVMSLSTDVHICSGQQLYCAAWICNPGVVKSNAVNPNFRFDVEGRVTKGEWETVSSFYTGEIQTGTGWQQIRFPLVSAQDYDESRVTIYNFAAANADNDFLIDDVWLYASRLPLTAYQTATKCAEGSSNEEFVASVIRVDYTNFTGEETTTQNVYYQFYNTSTDAAVSGNYYVHTEDDNTVAEEECVVGNCYGRIPRPAKTFEPTADIYTDVEAFIADVKNQLKPLPDNADNTESIKTDGLAKIGFVKAKNKKLDGTYDEHWVMYVVQMMPASKFSTKDTYEVRMAYSEQELMDNDLQCALRTNLPVYEPTSFRFNGVTYPAAGQCANSLYPIEILVQEVISDPDTKQDVTLSAYAKGDWLKGIPEDDVFYRAYLRGESTAPADSLLAYHTDSLYKQYYGYNRKAVETAIQRMRRETLRRLDDNNQPYYVANPNFTVSDVTMLNFNDSCWVDENLQGDSFEQDGKTIKYCDLVKDLCSRGLLSLYKERDYFYMHSQDTIRYWIFPIARTAKATYKDQEYILNECAIPKYIMVFTDKSNYVLDFGQNTVPEGYEGQVPRVRVPQSRVNEQVSVPIRAIGEDVVLARNCAQLEQTTDPDMAKQIGQSTFRLAYAPDRQYNSTAPQAYYHHGDTIHFTPITSGYINSLPTADQQGLSANTATMRAGYEYTMRVQMFLKNGQTTEEGSSCPIGYTYLTVVVVPDTLLWTPAATNEDGLYPWGDDRNWRGILHGQTMAQGYAPLPSTCVILPSNLPDKQYPYIESTSTRYPVDVNYMPNTCRKVQLFAHAKILGQEHLQYDSAYVDVPMTSSHWYTMAAPLQHVYSGDFYIPHSGQYGGTGSNAPKNMESSEPFQVQPFSGTRSRFAPYAFWTSYFNRNVTKVTVYGNETIESTTATFLPSNALDETLAPGQGVAMLGFGPNDDEETLTIRLPKPDTEYRFYAPSQDGKPGNETKETVTLDRTNAHRFAFAPTSDGYMEVTISNATPNKEFLFGNPTMAYLNVFAMIDDHNRELSNNELESKYILNRFDYISDDAWQQIAGGISDEKDGWIAPMQSVRLHANRDMQSLTLKIKPEFLSLSRKHTESKTINKVQGHPFRREIMRMVAYTPDAAGYATLAAMDFADNAFDYTEDMPFTSSGVEQSVNSAAATTPVNLYTLAGTQSLSVDIRDQIGVVPIGFVIADDYRTDSLTLYFGLNSTWQSECYLCDNQTHQRYPICNDTRIRIATPRNHEIRYYIQGPDKEPDNPNPPTGTDQEPMSDPGRQQVIAVSNAPQTVVVIASDAIAELRAYDIAGQQLTHIIPTTTTPVYTLNLPSGVVLIKVQLTNGHTTQCKTIIN